MGIVTQLRGTDGAGIYIDKVDGTNSYQHLPHFAKSEYDFCDLLATDYYVNSIADVMIGHCRAATVGVINEANAHPFKHGDLVMAHNGTIWSDVYNQNPTLTDSEQLVMACAQHGMVEGLEQLSFWDAYAITAVDVPKGSLFFAKNDQRPFWLALNKDRDVMYWCSERELLTMVLDRVGIKNYSVYTLDDEILHEVKVNEIKAGETKIFYKTKLTHTHLSTTKRSNVVKPQVDDDEDVEPKCKICSEQLVNLDYVWGVYSTRYNGIVCESCTQEMKLYAN